MIYFIVIILLLAFELLYLRLASRRDALIVPYWSEVTSDERDFITVRGGRCCFLDSFACASNFYSQRI